MRDPPARWQITPPQIGSQENSVPAEKFSIDRSTAAYQGNLPSFDLAKNPIDVYATDAAYWRSFWHRPSVNIAVDLQQKN